VPWGQIGVDEELDIGIMNLEKYKRVNET